MTQNENQDLERILESAVVANWADLTAIRKSDLIQIEYGFATDGTLDYLKVWSSISRGHWLLVCSYWMFASNSHSKGVHFDNDYHSEGLAHLLDFLMQHQNAFNLPVNLGREGLLQIAVPTPKDSSAATESVREAFERIELQPSPAVLA